MSFIEELKRRNVVKVAILYLVASWLVLQVGSLLFDALSAQFAAIREQNREALAAAGVL